MILLTAIIFSCCCKNTVFASSIPMFSIGEVYGKIGETVSVDISVKNNPGFNALKLTLEYDEAIVIIRGDIDEDGLVEPADNLLLKDHLLKKSYITGYRLYAADVDEEEGVLIENAIKPSDNNKLMNYLLKKSSTLNN